MLTPGNMQRKRIHLVNRSCLCQKSEEKVEHLLFHCSIT